MDKTDELINILLEFKSNPTNALIEALKFLVKNRGLQETLSWQKRDCCYYAAFVFGFGENCFVIKVGHDETSCKFEIDAPIIDKSCAIVPNIDSIQMAMLIVKLYFYLSV